MVVTDLNSLTALRDALLGLPRGQIMYAGKLIFSQLMDHLSLHTFRRCVSRYQGEHYVKRFHCFDQYLIVALAQLTYRESLRDIEACLRAHQSKLYHMGIRSSSVARNTLSKATDCVSGTLNPNTSMSCCAGFPLFACDSGRVS